MPIAQYQYKTFISYAKVNLTFVSYLNSHLGYSAGEFQALQLIVLAVFGAVD